MTETKYPSFTIVCPNCTMKQTGFLKKALLKDSSFWQCMNKTKCQTILYDFEMADILGTTVRDFNPKTL